jgi:hypothetical protein
LDKAKLDLWPLLSREENMRARRSKNEMEEEDRSAGFLRQKRSEKDAMFLYPKEGIFVPPLLSNEPEQAFNFVTEKGEKMQSFTYEMMASSPPPLLANETSTVLTLSLKWGKKMASLFPLQLYPIKVERTYAFFCL